MVQIFRAWAPAVLAALLWLASGGLEWLGRRLLSRPAGYVLDLVAPETIPVNELTAPAPWGPVMAGLSALALAGVYAALLAVVRRRREGSGGAATVAAYWFCAVLAGVSVAAVPVAVDLVGALRDQAVPTTFAGEHLVTIAHWGLVWGWLPALLARALDTPASGAPVPGRAAALVPAVFLFLAAVVGLVVAAPTADAARVAAIPAAAEPEPEPGPTGSPVPAVAPGEWLVDPLWCTTGQVEFAAGPVDAAAGSRVMPIVATNVSDAACVLESYPDVAFSDRATNALEVRVDHGGAMGSEDPGVARIELAPGGQAVAVLGWSAMSTSLAEPAGWLHVAAYHGAERQMVRVETDITGGAVSVTAWAPH